MQLDNPLRSKSKFYSIVSLKCFPEQLLPNLIISLSRGRITYQLTLGLLLLSSTPSIRDALRSKNFTCLLITGNFYTTKLIRLIHLCLVLYSFLRYRKEPLTILRLARNQYVNRTKHDSIDRQSQRNNINRKIDE